MAVSKFFLKKQIKFLPSCLIVHMCSYKLVDFCSNSHPATQPVITGLSACAGGAVMTRKQCSCVSTLK